MEETGEIISLTGEPIEPKPLISDILRTRYCIPGSVFLVEALDVIPTENPKQWRVIRLLLGDGELCIQTLLSGEMHRYVDGGEVAVGSYVKLRAFRAEWLEADEILSGKGKEKEVTYSPKKQMVYLVVDDLSVVGWNNRMLDMAEGDVGAGTVLPAASTSAAPERAASKQSVATHFLEDEQPGDVDLDLLEEIADADDEFETMAVQPEHTQRRRAEIKGPSQQSDYAARLNSQRLPWAGTDPSRPMKLTPLISIPNLPYRQNWAVNILAVVSAIMDPEPSSLPPFVQRQARLSDPSTNKQIHLTVFLDPEEFSPRVGSVVLLLAVKNHRFDGGSLKKYSSDRPKDGSSRWWYENPLQFSWCDVTGLRTWWEANSTNHSA